MTISTISRQRIRNRAKFLCEYCHSSEEASTSRFTFDHLIPQSLGGKDNEDNLALACHRCNGRRYNFTDGIDPETQATVPLFNPRQNKWSEHFIWSINGQKILGVSPIGRATIDRLDMNDERHDDASIQRARRLWIRGGWHPPIHDPQQSAC
ncbi:HNH endonuclease signature motif containing protein [Tumidithrix elongata RA019]|uniref:HNH endonuclease signature motif containing protein n=1 Tax=Tumidithrix elongata BACA0141 TaxID=2716417 RepID=A0AAW9Q7S8_9CYAN|nr:HNH endonuclease signature motif containing protein [Tumidithrix elongata RA019]